MGGVFRFLWRGVPAYFWVGLIYAVFAAGALSSGEGDPINLEARLCAPFFSLPLLGEGRFYLSLNTVFLILGFISVWIETLRATNIRDRSGNDWMSIFVTFAALLLFVGYGPFGTTAFLVVPLAGLGDLLLDRVIGQEVARRDFG